jgi:hypothetical protein
MASTLCLVHNQFGRYYLSAIVPFHKLGLRRLMESALAAQRLKLAFSGRPVNKTRRDVNFRIGSKAPA